MNYIFYYAQEMKGITGTVPVRYDPWDAGIAFCYLNGRWVKCISEHFAQFQRRSEKEIRIATEILRKNYNQTGTNRGIYGKRLAGLLTSADQEAEFRRQRLFDKAERDIRTLSNPNKTDDSGNLDEMVNQVKVCSDVASSHVELNLDIANLEPCEILIQEDEEL